VSRGYGTINRPDIAHLFTRILPGYSSDETDSRVQ